MEIYRHHITETLQCHSYRGIIPYIVKKKKKTREHLKCATNYFLYKLRKEREPLQLMKGV